MTSSKVRNTFGSINTLPARKGFVRIDACVPEAIGYAMTQLALGSAAVDSRLVGKFWGAQSEVGGSMLLDFTVSAPLAELMLAVAKRRRPAVPRRRAA
jgi:glycogen synthase